MKNIISVNQLVVDSNVCEIIDFFKATYYTTPPMRAVTGIRFPDGTICKYGEWILQYEDNSYSVIKNDVLQIILNRNQPTDDRLKKSVDLLEDRIKYLNNNFPSSKEVETLSSVKSFLQQLQLK